MPITSTALTAPVAGPRANPPDELTTLQALVAHANEVKVELALARRLTATPPATSLICAHTISEGDAR